MDDYHKEVEKRKNTPVECVTCHKKKLPDEMENPYVPSVCKDCAEIEKKAKEKERKANARPGLVQVIYGEHSAPKEDGGNGYSYYYDEPLNLGDIVEVPQTWLGSVKGESSRKLATVVSTYSDYNGSISCILRVIKKAK